MRKLLIILIILVSCVPETIDWSRSTREGINITVLDYPCASEHVCFSVSNISQSDIWFYPDGFAMICCTNEAGKVQFPFIKGHEYRKINQNIFLKAGTSDTINVSLDFELSRYHFIDNENYYFTLQYSNNRFVPKDSIYNKTYMGLWKFKRINIKNLMD